MCLLRIMQIKSIIQISQPPKIRIIPATILPSENLVIMPQIHAVMGMIARIKLTM